MRKNVEMRRLIETQAALLGGFVTTERLRDAARAAGFPDGDVEAADRYALALVREGVMRRAGKGRYAHLPTLGTGTQGVFARIPYGDHLYGRILRYMLTHRYVSAKQAFTALATPGQALTQARVSNAINRLRERGWIEDAGTRMYALTRKTLDAVGLADVIDEPGACEASLYARAEPHVLEQLRATPAKRVRDISRHLDGLGVPLGWERTHRLIRTLRKRLPIERVGHGAYALAPGPAAGGAAVPPVTPS